jgi:hypothetical protein
MATFGRRAFLASVALFSPIARRLALAQPQSFSLEEFLALSSRLTGRTDLDRAAADTFLKALLSTPGNAAKLKHPDAPLERAIIVSWYTGVHDVRGEQRLATHTGAIKWRALGIPAPGVCAGRFGAWSQPPRTTNR